jgi:hypothetical protein
MMEPKKQSLPVSGSAWINIAAIFLSAAAEAISNYDGFSP